tara:strand:+ start:2819 stop:5035 length:2217 start_codon:yes stop_codon:yes gene_type:complete
MLNRFYSIIFVPIALLAANEIKTTLAFASENNYIAKVSQKSSKNDSIRLETIGEGAEVKIVLSGIGNGSKYEKILDKNSLIIKFLPESPKKPIVSQSISLPSSGFRTISLNKYNKDLLLTIFPSKNTKLNEASLSIKNDDILINFPDIQISDLNNNKDVFKLDKIKTSSKAINIAKAPPLGDIAIGTTLVNNPNLVNIEGPDVSLVFKNTPAKNAIEFLVSKTDYGFVYVQDDPTFEDESSAAGAQLINQSAQGLTSQGGGIPPGMQSQSSEEKSSDSQRYITLSIQEKPFHVAFNSLLMASGLQATLKNNIVYVGPSVRDRVFTSRISRVYRLNSTTANAAASYLANLGAQVSKTSTITTAVSTGTSESESVSGASTSATTRSSSETTVQVYGSSIGPLVGLIATTDDRLQTITMIGDEDLIELAESYIKQLDLRQRQVALTVRILDINISDVNSFGNSWAFKTNNKFIVNDAGKLLGAFGDKLPPNTSDFTTSSSVYNNPATLSDYKNQTLIDFLEASIASENTKILASPTLILNEYPGQTGGDTVAFEDVTTALTAGTIGRSYGNEAFIIVGSQVPVNCTVEEGSTVPEFEYGISGLTFGARVTKIDDNGFVTFNISPAVSVAAGTENLIGCGDITLLGTRRLDSGSIRIRDGNTLILTGVLNSTDKETVTKVPLFGDLPIIGRFFRNTTSNKENRELVILVTPQILDGSDQELALGLSGYSPNSPEIKKLIDDN